MGILQAFVRGGPSDVGEVFRVKVRHVGIDQVVLDERTQHRKLRADAGSTSHQRARRALEDPHAMTGAHQLNGGGATRDRTTHDANAQSPGRIPRPWHDPSFWKGQDILSRSFR